MPLPQDSADPAGSSAPLLRRCVTQGAPEAVAAPLSHRKPRQQLCGHASVRLRASEG